MKMLHCDDYGGDDDDKSDICLLAHHVHSETDRQLETKAID